RFFPDAPADKAAITLHQLLTHTSGLRDTFGEEYEPVTRQELLRRVFASRLLGPPGRRYRYSNGGYSVLAAVVEVASGRTYDDYLRGRLFAPAGMRHTGFRLEAADLALLAHGYTADGDWGTPLDHPWAADGPYWNLRGNGGILSTTGDFYRWHLALAGDTVLARPQREKYIRPYVSEGRWAHTDYGYGWSVGKSPSGKTEVSHIGGNGAFESDFRRYLGDDAVIVLSGNSVDYSALAIGDHLENRLFGLHDADPPAVAAAPIDPQVPGAAGSAARCAGVYLLPPPPGSGGGAPRERLRVSVDAGPGTPPGRLVIAAEGTQGLRLLLGALGDDDRQLVAGRDEDVAAALDAAREGRREPFAKLMGLEAEPASALLAARIDPLTRQLGAWTSVTPLGGAARGGRWFTYVRCGFARGNKIAELGWAGPTAETLRFLDALPGQRFAAEAPGSPEPFTPGSKDLTPGSQDFAAFDVRTGSTVRAACEPPAAAATAAPAAPAAPAAAIALRSGGGAAVRAERLRE
ncbi:MAG: beta-lactamase family protein, partial [Acidobacteria bacterium]|nr:beta-lactamase family protein [Acidobacteriota bacterium]